MPWLIAAPASGAVAALVDGYRTRQPTRWVQLVGNHEAHYLRLRYLTGRSGSDTLRRWWAGRQIRVAAWVGDDTESFLAGHEAAVQPDRRE